MDKRPGLFLSAKEVAQALTVLGLVSALLVAMALGAVYWAMTQLLP